MAVEIRRFAFTIPAGTTQAAPITQDLAMPARAISQINVRVPPGPNGYMGFAVSMAGQAIIPANANSWVVTSDERIPWPLTNYPDSGAWQVKGYNTGTFPHTVYLEFLCDIPGKGAAAAAPNLITPTAIEAAAPPPPADTAASDAALAAAAAALADAGTQGGP